MKYLFARFDTSERKNNRDPAARFDRSILRIPGSGIAYATAHGRTEQIATYRADRLAAALTATQNIALNDIRRLAWLAEKQDYRWDLLVSLVRSVIDNVSTVEMEHPDPLSNFIAR
jgi:hypothetical protein